MLWGFVHKGGKDFFVPQNVTLPMKGRRQKVSFLLKAGLYVTDPVEEILVLSLGTFTVQHGSYVYAGYPCLFFLKQKGSQY